MGTFLAVITGVLGIIAFCYAWWGMTWLTAQCWDYHPSRGWGRADISDDYVPMWIVWPIAAALIIVFYSAMSIHKVLKGALGWAPKAVKSAYSWVVGLKGRKKTPEQVLDENNPTDILVNLIRQQMLLSPELVVRTRRSNNDASYDYDRFDIVFKKEVRGAEVKADLSLNTKYSKPMWLCRWLTVDGVGISLTNEQKEVLIESAKEALDLQEEFRKAEEKKKKELAACEAIKKILGLPKPENEPETSLAMPDSGVPLNLESDLLQPVKSTKRAKA